MLAGERWRKVSPNRRPIILVQFEVTAVHYCMLVSIHLPQIGRIMSKIKVSLSSDH